MIHVIGMGDDGPAGLAPAARAALERSQLVLAGPRLQARMTGLAVACRDWPRPIQQAVEFLRGRSEPRIAAVVSGDPLWFSLGARLAAAFPAAECVFHPNVSAFQMAACRMRWPLAAAACATLHGRPITRLAPLLGRGQRILLLTSGSAAPSEIAAYLTGAGYGATRMTVLANLGGPAETRRSAVAAAWRGPDEALHVLALEPHPGAAALPQGRAPGLPDQAYRHDGQLTKRIMRAATLSALRPMPGAMLWDLGCGSGSVAIEWTRAAPESRALAVDHAAGRLRMAQRNADALGAGPIEWLEADVAAALDSDSVPDAVFVGGGVSLPLLRRCRARLPDGGRIVANSVTFESEAVLQAACRRWGGSLSRISVETAREIGGRQAWRPKMPVVQWSATKFPAS